jgi:lysophospholipase L1-like esterase
MTSTDIPSEHVPEHGKEVQDPHCLTPQEVGALLRTAPWQRYAAIGDSVVAGVREPVEGYVDLGFADRVADALRGVNPDLKYRNWGVRDLTAAQIRETQLQPALEFAPDVAVVVVGGNDLLGRGFDTAGVQQEQAHIISALRDRGCVVVTMGLFDNTWTPYVAERYKPVMKERLRQYAELTQGISERLGALYIDLPSHPAGKEPIYASDGLHLNARGQAVVATEVVRKLAGQLAARQV